MANDVTTNPFVLDTASSTVTADTVRLASIRWSGATTDAHTAVLTNTAGKVIWSTVGQKPTTGAVMDVETTFPEPGLNTLGLKVGALGSGKLYVTYR